MKTPIAIIAFAGVLATPALAQTTLGQMNAAPMDSQFIARAPNTSMRLSKLIGVDVVGLDHIKIGDIDEVLIGRDGRIAAVVIGVGSFLGVGGKDVAIPFGEVLWNTGDVSRVATAPAGATPGSAPSAERAAGAAERMPGAQVSDRALEAVQQQRSGTVDPSTGPVTTGSTERATVPVLPAGGTPERAMVRLTRGQLEQAPAFRYAGQREGTSAPTSPKQ